MWSRDGQCVDVRCQRWEMWSVESRVGNVPSATGQLFLNPGAVDEAPGLAATKKPTTPRCAVAARRRA